MGTISIECGMGREMVAYSKDSNRIDGELIIFGVTHVYESSVRETLRLQNSVD